QVSEEQEALLSQQLQLLVSWVDKPLDASPLLPSTLSELAFLAAASLLAYIYQTQMRDLDHLKPVEVYQIADSLRMDFATKQSLDLTEHARTGKKQGSLLGVLDQTRTAMGLRLLRRWIQQPLLDQAQIEQRQEQVTILLEAFFERQDLVESLKGVYDIERLVSRVSFGKTLPKDLLQLSATLGQVPQIRQLLLSLEQAALEPLVQGLDPLEELYALIDAAIDPQAPNQLMDGGLIKTGFDPVLDQYRKALREGTSWLADLESRERQATGINNLKIDYNRKDGYYFHVT
ncbi:DNA mismatch repair protein MutS, partial [Streptococcus danieliae]|nr:DNA mismatch repair protein MutS [Streptococcus danieliae]